VCAACRLLNQYLLDGGVFNILQAGKGAIGTADFGGLLDKKPMLGAFK